MKILVVDDEIPIREWIAYTINKLNITCEVIGLAANGAEALRLYESEAPDVVLTDIKMPVMDGIELLKNIRKSKRNCYVVILTSHDDFNYARQALSFNADEYILKTEINDNAIMGIIERCKGKNYFLNQPETFETILKKNAFINEIVNNNIKDTASIKEMLSNGDISLKEGYIAVISFYMDRCKLGREFRQVLNIGKEDLIDNCICFIYNNDILLIAVNLACVPSQNRQIETLRGFASSIENVINRSISVSPIYFGLANLSRAANESISGLKIEFYNNKRTVVYVNSSIEFQKQKGEIDQYLDKILSLIEKKKLEESLNELQNLTTTISAYEYRDTEYIKKLYLQIINQYALMYSSRESKKIIQIVQDAQAEFSSVKSYHELVLAAERRINDVICSHSVNNRNYSDHTKRAINYTGEHYATIDKITEVAQLLNLNTEYFCRLFKSEVGVTYGAYLTNVRMTKAMELIKNTNINIYEIASQVGYNNVSYFSRIFKKTYGKNPFRIRSGK